MLYAAGFAACAVIIFFAGKKLSYYGDMLGGKMRLGKAWVGLILMASVTSLPELMTGIGASAIVQSADLAVGDIFGSCAFNLGILAMMDAFVPRRQPLLSIASQNHILSAALGIILIALAGFNLFMKSDMGISSWISIGSLTLILLYLGSIRLLYNNEKKLNVSAAIETPQEKPAPEIALKTIVRNYIVFAFVIVAAALALPYFADRIAEEAGLSKSFVGTLFLAASTSLPEIAVSIAAVRMGSIDMAIGGLLGSNIFNILILGLDDIFYTKGFILHDASDVNIVSVFGTVIMTSIVVIGLIYRVKGKRWLFAWDALLIFGVYVVNIILLYRLTS